MKSATDKKSSTPSVEPLLISRAKRTTTAQLARERARELWRQRALRIFVNAVIAAVGLRIAAIAVQPCMAAYRSSRNIRVLRAQLHHEAARNQHLQSQIAYLNSDGGVEEEARKLGWTRPGEVALQIVTPEPPARTPAVGVSGSSSGTPGANKLPSRVSVSERIRLAVTRWLERGKGKK